MRFKTAIAMAILVLFTGPLSSLQARPEWIDRPPKDNQFKYYIGRSGVFSNERDAVTDATRNAIEQAVSQNFGISAQIQKDSYESLSAVQLTTKIRELTDKVNLKGFEQVEFHREPEGKNVSVWILFRYPLEEIEKEKRRLSHESKSKVPVQFSESGLQKSANGTVLEIVTDPQGASVFIDGQIFGRSPLRILGQVEAGQHRLRIEHPDFENVEEELLVPVGNTLRIDKMLMRASGKISITTNPPNALVVLNGKVLGNSPIESLTFPAGEKLALEISSSETERYVQEVTIEKGTTRPLKIDLPLKPSFVSVSAEPNNATVLIDGASYSAPVQKLSIKAGTHRIQISKEGYLPYETSINVRGNTHEILPTIRLISWTEEQIRLRNFPWLVSLDLGLGSSPLKNKGMLASRIGGSLEKKFYGLVGLRGSVGYLYASDGGGLKQNKKLQGWEFSGALPMYYRNFILGPEAGYFTGEYSEKIFHTTLTGTKQQVGTTRTDYNSIFYGGLAGYDFFRQSNWGFSIEGRIRKYQDSNGSAGAIQVLVGGNLKFRF